MTQQTSSKQCILMSNWDTKRGEYPNNRPSNFETKLIDAWTLHGEWEATISQLSFPRTWHNFHEERTLEYNFLEMSTQIKGDGRFTIPKGYYKSPDSVLTYIVAQINYGFRKNKAYSTSVDYRYDKRIRNSTIIAKGVLLIMKENRKTADNMFQLLGFNGLKPSDKKEIEEHIISLKTRFPLSGDSIDNLLNMHLKEKNLNESETNIFWAEIPTMSQPARQFEEFSELFIYMDFVRESNIGNTRAPFMAMVPLVDDSDSNDQTMVTFNPLIWIPVAKSRISTIRILLADEEGSEINLHDGMVIANITLRRRTI